jgi:hypothetical protein
MANSTPLPAHVSKSLAAKLAHTHNPTMRGLGGPPASAHVRPARPHRYGPVAPGYMGARRRELATTEAVNAALHQHGLSGGLTETNIHKLRRLGYTVSKSLVEKMHTAKAAAKKAAKAKKTAKKAAKKAAKAKKTAKKAAKKAATAKKAVKKAKKAAPKRAKKAAPKRAKAAKKAPKRAKKAAKKPAKAKRAKRAKKAAATPAGCRMVSHTEALRIYNEARSKAGKKHVKTLPAAVKKTMAKEGVLVEAKRRSKK